jgi:Trk-type K+ transport system membrane component
VPLFVITVTIIGLTLLAAGVLAALILVSIAAMAWIGASSGSVGRRGTVTSLILSALIALVVVMVVDFDQPRSGIVRVGQLPLVDLQRSFP